MGNKYLAIFLQNRGLKTSYAENILYGGGKTLARSHPKNNIVKPHLYDTTEVISGGDNIPQVISGGDNIPQVIYKGGKSSVEDLSKKLIKAIQDALLFNRKMGKVSQINSAEHTKQVDEDIIKIKNLDVSNQIDMLFGGGFLMFDSNFNIKQMIYTCFKDGENPVFSSNLIGTTTGNDSINKILQTEMKPYVSSVISGEILKIAPPTDFTVNYADVHFKKRMLR